MNKSLLTLLLFFIFFSAFSQLSVIESSYTNWNGETFDTYLIEGQYTVVQIDKNIVTQEQINDIPTLAEILNRIDSYYLFYKNFYGKEPVGGMPEYGFKSSVAFAAPSCGAACGLIGAKGIEVSPGMFVQIYGETKYNINTNRIGIVGYEFGRNFFTMGSKLLFPYTPGTDDLNGGFAEGFAAVTELLAYTDYLEANPKEHSIFQESLFYYSQIHNGFRAYTNDVSANPYTTMAKAKLIPDLNRNTSGFTIFGATILVGTYELFKSDELFPKFFDNLRQRNDVSTIEDALGNISYSFSKATNYDLSAYFLNVLKFEIDENTLNEIKALPKVPNRLIKDKGELWFTTPYDTISLNIRSINYLDEDEIYQLFIDDELISESKDGNNLLSYSVLKKRDSVILKTRLLNKSRALIDEQSIVLKKRHDINLKDYYQDFYLTEGNGHTRGYRENDDFILENFTNIEAWTYLEMPFPVKKDRVVYIEGTIRNEKSLEANLIDSNGDDIIDFISGISLGGRWGSHGTVRVGYDIGKDDNSNFYNVNVPIETNLFFNSNEANSREFLEQKIYLTSIGVTRSTFKDVLIKDNTDIDNDGIVDFEDNCFETYNPDQLDIDNDGLGDVCDDDIDGDGVLNIDDNCPETANSDQEDLDRDGIGDICDDDWDGDGILNDVDNCPEIANSNQLDLDGDGIGDVCDDDWDGDGVLNDNDNCPEVSNADQSDIDGDGKGDVCDDDIDGDGILNAEDNCPEVVNENQEDIDGDGEGDVCDDDWDGDGVLNSVDNCPETANSDQADFDGDDIGDTCDDDIDGDGVLNDEDKCANTPTGTSVDANGCALLDSNNFTIEVIGETCPDKNNGQIVIEAQTSNSYIATFSGVDYEFTTTKTIDNLVPGDYEICIVITDQTSPYCYNITIGEGTTVSGKSSTTKSKTTVDILEGTAPYDVYVNGTSILRTMSSTFDINTKHGDLIEVKTDKSCEGVYSKTVQLFDIMTLYPNPTQGLFELAIPLNLNEVDIEMYNYNSQLISKNTYQVSNGKVQLDLSSKAVGMYYVKVLSDTPVMLKIIKK